MNKKDDATYAKSKHIIESNKLESTHMDTLAVKYNVPDKHLKRYEEEKVKENLKEAYDKILTLLDKYVDMDDKNKIIITLWIIGTYFHKEFETYPYLFLNAMRGSGKTRSLKLITKLAKNGKILISLTDATLFRNKGTLGIDEFENLGSKDKQSLRELLNAGYKKGINVSRMKKQKTMSGEEQVNEEFECYRPVVMANIWGMEEVLGDRCITIILEKSNKKIYTKLIDNFENNQKIEEILLLLNSDKCRLCRYVTEKNINNVTILDKWNDFITSLYSLTSLSTLTSLTSLEKELFTKIDKVDIEGRDLELYFPFFLIANEIGEELLNTVLEIAKNNIENKRIDDITESKDVMLYSFVSRLEAEKFYKIKQLTNDFKLSLGDGDSNFEWLNTKWIGRALKRLNLINHKRKVSDGKEVILNIKKAKDKLEMFR